MKETTITFLSTILFVLSFVLPVRAEFLVLTDSSDAEIARLPIIERGDAKLIPLNMLARKTGWKLETVDDSRIMDAMGLTVRLQEGNPFVKVDSSFIQLPVLPEEWDGSLWIPAESLFKIFPDSYLRRNLQNGSVKVLRISEEISVPADSVIKQAAVESPQEPPEEQWTLGTVIIDPGHGGKDPGAVGLNGLKEKEVTLDVAHKLASYLKDRGIHVVMTRDSDQFVPLNERTQLANSSRGDLFVSIHANSSTQSDVRGVETYFLKPARTQRAIQAAIRENSVVELEDNTSSYQELTDQNYILLTMATSQYMKDSEKWAALAIKRAVYDTGLPDRGVDQAGFYVLIGASMPSILFECGYLSNPDDAKTLSSERGRQKIANAIGESITELKSSLEASAKR